MNVKPIKRSESSKFEIAPDEVQIDPERHQGFPELGRDFHALQNSLAVGFGFFPVV
jgi:hypothetical protein